MWTVGLGIDEAGINEDRDMLQEMRMALTVHRVPGMDHSAVPNPAQIMRMATEHGGRTTAFGTEIGRLDPGRKLDAVVIDYNSATFPYQSPDIAPLDALIYRAKSKDVHCVMVDGTIVYQDGEFMGVSREEILDTISRELSKPLSDEEQSRRDLREQVFESVEAFYENYLNGEIERAPFYPSSSRL